MAMQEIAVKGKDEGMHVLCLVPGLTKPYTLKPKPQTLKPKP